MARRKASQTGLIKLTRLEEYSSTVLRFMSNLMYPLSVLSGFAAHTYKRHLLTDEASHMYIIRNQRT